MTFYFNCWSILLWNRQEKNSNGFISFSFFFFKRILLQPHFCIGLSIHRILWRRIILKYFKNIHMIQNPALMCWIKKKVYIFIWQQKCRSICWWLLLFHPFLFYLYTILTIPYCVFSLYTFHIWVFVHKFLSSHVNGNNIILYSV